MKALKTALRAIKRADRINYTRVEWDDWSRRPYCKGCGVAFADDYDTSQPANRAATYLCPTCEQGIASEPDGVML
jgi:hypothetical protein